MLTVKNRIKELLTRATSEAQRQGRLPAVTSPEITVEHPQNPGHGDYASSVCLKLARATGIRPLDIAAEITRQIGAAPEIDAVTVVPPGFINFVIKSDWLTGQVEAILAGGDAFGEVDLGQGERVQIEFVSVNPTGPLHVGHGRAAILGSTLANILAAAGYRVEKEYYINDAGSQVEAFSRSLYARYQQGLGNSADMPAEGYIGTYMIDLAGEIIAEQGDRYSRMPPAEALSRLGELGLARMVERIRVDLGLLGVDFDVWFSEKGLHEDGKYGEAINRLRQGGFIIEKEGATWFASTALGNDKDNVVVRGDGSPTYFASDVAYHYDKFLGRKFDRVIDIWGADHQGHVSRMKAVVEALGVDPGRLQIIITQMVTLRRGDEMVRVSKRSGDIITLREVVEEVGRDACRFFFLSRSADSQMDFDLELAKKESADNPVYYVQYAHARIASILRLARERGIYWDDGDVSRLVSEPELALIRKMLLLPEVVETISRTLGPHHLPYYAVDLATVFHSFYKQCRVVSEDEPLTKARLKLVAAAKLVLSRALHFMGMTAPEKM